MLAASHKMSSEDDCDDFLQMLRRLGGSAGVNYCCCNAQNGRIQEVQVVFVSCPRKAWVEKLGEPQHVYSHFDATSGRWIRSWEQPLPQGQIRCIGHFFTRVPATAWVIVKQLQRDHQQTMAIASQTLNHG